MVGHENVLKEEHKLPGDVRGSKTYLLKLSNMNGRKTTLMEYFKFLFSRANFNTTLAKESSTGQKHMSKYSGVLLTKRHADNSETRQTCFKVIFK